MSTHSAIATIVAVTDLLIPVTLLTTWLALRRALPGSPALPVFAAALAAALASGALWVWWPTLAAFRLSPAPGGQPLGIISVVVGFAGLLALPVIRDFFRQADLRWLVTMGVWRIVYGAALLLIGVMGGLPPAFFWSAAFGDIAVGVWGVSMMARGLEVSGREVTGWNVVGLLDLAHVLVLGGINLRPFYLANPGADALNLLPMAGVPVFLALHIMTLWGLRARAKAARPATRSLTQS